MNLGGDYMYKLSDLMNMFSLPERTIRRHLADGTLKGKKIGGSWRFDDEDIRDYLDNPRIRLTNERNNIKEIMDYVNGLTHHKNEMLFVVNLGNIPDLSIDNLTQIVNQMQNQFYFNVTSHGSDKVMTFIGVESDVITLIKAKEKLYEKNL